MAEQTPDRIDIWISASGELFMAACRADDDAVTTYLKSTPARERADEMVEALKTAEYAIADAGHHPQWEDCLLCCALKSIRSALSSLSPVKPEGDQT